MQQESANKSYKKSQLKPVSQPRFVTEPADLCQTTLASQPPLSKPANRDIINWRGDLCPTNRLKAPRENIPPLKK